MKLHELSPAEGSTHARKRVGRGHGSGWGKTAGKGHKGQNARSGGGVRPGFEGGQMPLQRRVPKRGFVNIYRTVYENVSVGQLSARFEDGATVDAQALLDANIIKDVRDGVKVLSNGDIDKKLTVKAAAFSKAAQEKIEKAGGKTEVV